MKILLVEDTDDSRVLFRSMLEKLGHDVIEATNGREAVQVAVEQSPDLVLMDLSMPEVDGFQATAAIREKEKTTGDHIPIIAMTGYAMKGDRQRCLEAGMDAYICKPIRSQELFEAIESFTSVTTKEKDVLAPLLLDNE